MNNYKKYGSNTCHVVLVHGGPGACGEMQPVGQKLAECFGVLEPLNRALTIEGQLKELCHSIEACTNEKPVLAGFSWGAWLCILFAARYPNRVSKLILIGCPPIEHRYAQKVFENRMDRLDNTLKNEFTALLKSIEADTIDDRRSVYEKLNRIVLISDSYDPDTENESEIAFDLNVFTSVWKEAAELRKSGKLAHCLENIQCPVVAIHGEYDPHPAEGILMPLKNSHCSFQFEMIKKCGHKPWIEKRAREYFYHILTQHL